MSENLKHNSKNENKSFPKKKLAIICAVVAVVAAIVAIVGVVIVNNSSKEISKPTEKQIIKDLNSLPTITKVKAGNRELEFEVTKADVSREKISDDKETYSFRAAVVRENKTYSIAAVDYEVVYKLSEKQYKLNSASTSVEDFELTAIAGADKSNAEKRVKRVYGDVKFAAQDTDLEKGIDRISFKLSGDEYDGTVAAVYRMNSKKGWVFRRLDASKLGFKKGVTHKENGLYTNSAVKNVLFLGVDGYEGAGRSDVMMLVSIDNNTGKIKLTSFMRDNWFNIPGYGTDKLNAAFAYGGAELTVKTISQTFGVKIDNYAQVDFTTFRNIINALGGVDVDITADEAGYVNWQLRKNGQSGYGLLKDSGGVQHLNGHQALWFCRDRGGNGFSGDDFMRTGRQRRVVQSIAKSFRNLTPGKLLKLIYTVKKDNVNTDLSKSDLVWYAKNSSKLLSYKFMERCVPQDGEWQAGWSDGGAWIIDLNDFEGLKSDIQKMIYEDLK